MCQIVSSVRHTEMGGLKHPSKMQLASLVLNCREECWLLQV